MSTNMQRQVGLQKVASYRSKRITFYRPGNRKCGWSANAFVLTIRANDVFCFAFTAVFDLALIFSLRSVCRMSQLLLFILLNVGECHFKLSNRL